MLSNYDHQFNNKVSLAACLFAAHVALTPIHQALLLPNGSTVNKYLVLAIIAIALVEYIYANRYLSVNKSLTNILIPLVLWICLTAVWSVSRSQTISSLITVCSHIALLVLCATYPFSQREKRLIRYALIAASVIYAISLITGMLGGEELRATITVGESRKESDQNLLSVNIGVAVLMAFDNTKKESKRWLKISNLIAIIIIIAGMFSTGSRGGIIATLIPFIYLLFKLYPGFTWKTQLWIILGVLFALYMVSDYSFLSDYILSRYNNAEAFEGNSGRSEIWIRYLTMMVYQPYMFLLGSGCGAENAAYGAFYSTSWPPATHNDYVSWLVSSGVFGLFMIGKLVHYCWSKAKTSQNHLTKACILSALIAAMSLNTTTRYGFWNVLIFALINI